MELFAAILSVAGIPAESLTVHDHVSRPHICQASAVAVKGILECIIIHFFLLKSIFMPYNKSKMADKTCQRLCLKRKIDTA